MFMFMTGKLSAFSSLRKHVLTNISFFEGRFICDNCVFSHCLFGRTHYAALVVKGIADLGRIRRPKDLPGLIDS